MKESRSYAFDTRAIHAGEAPDPVTGAHGVPLYQNSTFAFRSFDQVEQFKTGVVPHFDYTRGGNPTVRCFELKMADLEDAAQATTAATGMAAISATLSEAVARGGHLVAPNNVYHYTREFFEIDLPALGVSVSKVPIGDLDAVEAAVRPETRAIYCETFSNPNLDVADLDALSGVARRHGALLIVDNTFLSPAILRPLEHGADLVIHSATKYLSGTGQVMGGVVAGDCGLIGRVQNRLTRTGGTMTPFAAWMLLAGVKTLSLRMERHCRNAMALAELLHADDAVEDVLFPGIASHPGHEAAVRMVGDRYGGLLTVRLNGGQEAARSFVGALRLSTIAVSLGEPTTLVWPLGEGMVRVAAGLEDRADLIADFEAGLAAVRCARTT